MGGHRDELSLHERSLDVLVGLLKEEMVSLVIVVVFVNISVYQLDETVSLAGLEKAINYFEVGLSVCLSVCLSLSV